MSYVVRPVGAFANQKFVLRRVNFDVDPGSGGGGTGTATPVDGVLPATPILLGGVSGGSGGYLECSVRWDAIGATVTEGDTIDVVARLSQALPVGVSIPILVEATTGANTGTSADLTVPTEVSFVAGSQVAVVTLQANAITPSGSATFVEVAVSFDTSGLEAYGDGSLPAVNVDTSPAWGASSMVIQIEDATPPASPEWRWVGVQATGTPSVPEAFGLLNIPIQLSHGSATPTEFTITITPGTATPTVDYNLMTPTVTIPAGETSARVQIEIVDNALSALPTATCSVAAAVTSGSATLGAGGFLAWVLSIDDNDAGLQPVIEWSTQAIQVVEGGPAVVLRGRIQNGPLASALAFSVSVSGNAEVGVDYLLQWAASPGVGIAPAGVSVFDIVTLTAVNDGFGDPGEVAVFTIDSIPLPAVIGTADEVTVSIQDAGTSTTEAFVALGTGLARNMIQGLVAVSPPSTTLPVYMMDGKRCQTVGFSRDGDGNWDAAYVYALVDQDTASIPGGANALVLELADGTEDVPADAFAAEPAVTYRIRPANVADDFEREASGSTDANWTGPSASYGWEQVGADIVRETFYSSWLRAAGTTALDGAVAAGLASADERCCLVESVTTKVQGFDLLIVSGRLHSGQMDYDDLVSDTGVDSKVAPGGVHLLRFEAEIPSGYTPIIIDAHPGMGVSGQVLTFIVDRGTDYYFPSCSEYQFRFAVIPSSGGNVSAGEAQAYLERSNIATFIGALGVDQNPIFGEAKDYALNLERAGFNPAGTAGDTAWRRVLQVSDTIAGVTGGQGFVSRWVDGGRDSSVGLTVDRFSWMHPFERSGIDAPGGGGIDGSQGLLPCPGWWRRADLQRFSVSNRIRLAVCDPTSPQDRGAWWWNVAEDGTGVQAGQRVMPTHYAAVTSPSLYRPPWFKTPQDATPSSSVAAWLSTYERAPTSRPWNTHEIAPDADMAIMISSWNTFSMTHQSRVRNPINDGWWGCREPMARLLHEGTAAFATRCYPPVAMPIKSDGSLDRQQNSIYTITTGVGSILAYLEGPSGQANYTMRAGMLSPSSPARTLTLETLRSEAWALTHVMSFYATGRDSERDLINGSSYPQAGGVAWWRPMITWLNHICTDAGILMRRVNGTATPNQYDETGHGTTDVPTLTGAHPSGTTGWNESYNGPDLYESFQGFQTWWALRAIFIWRSSMESGSSIQTVMDRVFDLPRWILERARHHTQERGEWVWQHHYPLKIVGDTIREAAPLTQAQIRAGTGYWRMLTQTVTPPGGNPFTISAEDEKYKMLNALTYCIRATGNLDFLNVAASTEGEYPAPAVGQPVSGAFWPLDPVVGGVIDLERLRFMFENLMRRPGGQSWESIMGSNSSGNIRRQYNGVQSWWTAFMAYLQQLGV